MLRTALAAGIMTISAFAFAADAPQSPLLENGGAEQGKGDEPSIWAQATVPADGLKLSRDDQQPHAGKYSLYIENNHAYKEQVSNNWMQELEHTPAGKRVRLSGWIKAQDADAVNICLQCWDESGKKMLAFVSTAVIKGDQDWKRATTKPVMVPPNTATVTVRAALTGKGKAWFDDIEVVEERGQRGGDGAGASPESSLPLASSTTKNLSDAVQGKVVRRIPVTKDAMVISYLAQGQYGNLDYVAVADNTSGVRGFFGFGTVGEIAPNQRAILALHANQETRIGVKPSEVEVHEVLADWNETVQWSNMPQVEQTAAVKAEFQPGAGWKLFDVTSIAKNQLKNKTTSRGVMIQFSQEDKEGNTTWSGYQFNSRESAEELKPVLLVVE